MHVYSKEGQISTGKTLPDGTAETRDATAADKMGGVGINLSIGSSKSQSTSTQTSDSAAGSSLTAGGNITLTAKGGGAQSDILLQGTKINAGKNLTLDAEDEIRLLAAKSTYEQHSTNKNSSASVGIGFTVGGTQNGFTIQAGVSGGKGKADGHDLVHSTTQVTAGKTLTLKSGGDTTLQGAVAQGEKVIAEIGGDLKLESLQDTSTFDSKQKSLGVSVSLCIPPFCYGAPSTGSVSASGSKVKSDYASVVEQTGLKAGDGGFQIDVKGNTDLKGAVITSTQTAIDEHKNRLSTSTLTTSDIENKAEASAKSSGINLSTDMLTQGKYGIAKGVVGNALNNAKTSGNSSGQTRAVVSAGTVVITDEARQITLNGKTAEQTVVALNRNEATAHVAAKKIDTEAMRRQVEAERTIKNEAVKQLTVLTDESYRVMFKEKPLFYKVVCPTGMDCTAQPEKAIAVPLNGPPEQVQGELAKAGAGSVLAVDGILNPLERAAQLAMQNAELVTTDANGQPLLTPTKPTELYLMHYVPANNTISELLVGFYETKMAASFGYTNQDHAYADSIEGRGEKLTVSLGHSRGTAVQMNASEINAERGYTNENLSVRGVGGAVGVQAYTDAAAKVIGNKDKIENSITYNYFAHDPVPVAAGGNPGVLSLSEFWRVMTTSNSAHSCYGTGVAGCQQVEILSSNGPKDAVQDNNSLIRYKGGVQVDAQGKPVNAVQR